MSHIDSYIYNHHLIGPLEMYFPWNQTKNQNMEVFSMSYPISKTTLQELGQMKKWTTTVEEQARSIK